MHLMSFISAFSFSNHAVTCCNVTNNTNALRTVSISASRRTRYNTGSQIFCILSSNSVSKAASLFAYDPTVTGRLLPITRLLFYNPFTPVTSALNLENYRGQLPVS